MAVVTLDRALNDTQRAFDAVAATYDRSNAENPILCAMRQRVRAVVLQHAEPGARLLDLGCGPGTDLVPFAADGFDVTAIDSSAAMVGEARRRVREAGVGARVEVHQRDIQQVDRIGGPFDVAYSNFGAMNCVPDLGAAARAIAAVLPARGWLIASVIGRICLWEIGLYAARLDWRRLAVRFSRGPVAVPLERRTVWTRYYTPREFARAFAPCGLAVRHVRALALAAPPPYLQHVAARHPDLVDRLHRVDDRIGAWPLLRGAGDHFLIVLQRT